MKFFSDWIVTERPRDGEMENSSQFSVLGSLVILRGGECRREGPYEGKQF
jgi:hypothetical protein